MNRTSLFTAAIVVGFLATFSLQLKAQVETATQFDKLHKYIDNLTANDKFMGAVVISKNGQVLFQHYAGHATIDTAEITAKTQFRIGSITKTYIATLVMQLIEQKQLSLSTPLAEYFPEFTNAKQITIEHLLSHQSGISNFTDDPGYSRGRLFATNRTELLTQLKSSSPLFNPGIQHRYSNSNYVLLGWIIEDILNLPLQTVVEKRIAEPLGLENTVLGLQAKRLAEEANSYRMSQSWTVVEPTHLSIPGGAGAMIATALDVDMFLRALFTNRLLSEESVAAMRQLQQGYGLGLVGMPFYQQRFYGHNGSTDGFLSSAAYNLADGVALTVLSNGINYGFNDILIAALSAVYGVEFELQDFSQQPVSLSAEVQKQAVGHYASEQLPLDITFTLVGDQLFAQATGQNRLPLTSYSAFEYRFEAAGITIIFAQPKSEKLPYQSFTLYQGGGKFDYLRTD